MVWVNVVAGTDEKKNSTNEALVFMLCFSTPSETGCSQEEAPQKGFVMGSRTQGVQEIFEKYI